MICPYPLTLRDGQVPCGKCANCLINRRRGKTARILLEQQAWARAGAPDASVFVTLTYDPDNLPLTQYDGFDLDLVKKGEQRVPRPTLVKKHLQSYIKRVRKALPERHLNYVGIGEYGDLNFRPHYHLVLFGVTPEDEALLKGAWRFGERFQMDPLIPERAAYAAGYTLKKLTPEKKAARLAPAEPEFAHWSLKPAIGLKFVPYLVAAMEQFPDVVRDFADINFTVRIGGKEWPLDRYMRTKMREFWNSRNQFQIPEKAVDRVALATKEKVKREYSLLELENISNHAVRYRPRKSKVF